MSKREKKWTRSRSSGRKKYHTLSKKKQGENVDKKKRAPSNSRTTTTLSLSLHLDLHRAAKMHARVLSSSAGAPAATRGGGHVKVGFNVLIQSAPSISPSRPLSRSAFPVLSPAIALIHIRGHFLFQTPCSQGEARTRDEQDNLARGKESGFVVGVSAEEAKLRPRDFFVLVLSLLTPSLLLPAFRAPTKKPRKRKKQPSSPPLRSLTATATATRTRTTTTTTTRASSSNDGGESNSAANVVAANPLFAGNPAFAAVLSDSLSRQGSGALVSGEARNPDEEFDKEGPIEEVLASCLRDQRQAVVQLENLEKVVKSALERERKQFDRLQFAFKKAGNDRAYAQSLAKLRKRCGGSFYFPILFERGEQKEESERASESAREEPHQLTFFI